MVVIDEGCLCEVGIVGVLYCVQGLVWIIFVELCYDLCFDVLWKVVYGVVDLVIGIDQVVEQGGVGGFDEVEDFFEVVFIVVVWVRNVCWCVCVEKVVQQMQFCCCVFGCLIVQVFEVVLVYCDDEVE